MEKKINLTPRIVYSKLCSNPLLLGQRVEKLNKHYKMEIDVQELIRLIGRIKSYTICVKLRSFQYRILLMAITTNVHLKHYGIKSSDSCSFCDEKKEMAQHLFVECSYVKQLWNYISKVIKKDLTGTQIITNDIKTNLRLVENCIVLLVKYYIYVTRCNKTRISVKSCQNYLKMYKDVEEQIVKEQEKLHLHNLKWSNCREL